MEGQALTPAQQRIEDNHLASLSERERDEYRIHVEAGGLRVCEYMANPDAPTYRGLQAQFPDDLPPQIIPADATREERMAGLIGRCGEIKQHITGLVHGMRQMGDELEDRYEAAAHKLGLEHALRD